MSGLVEVGGDLAAFGVDLEEGGERLLGGDALDLARVELLGVGRGGAVAEPRGGRDRRRGADHPPGEEVLAAAVVGVAVGEQEDQAAPLDAADLLAGAGAVGAEAGLPAGVRGRVAELRRHRRDGGVGRRTEVDHPEAVAAQGEGRRLRLGGRGRRCRRSWWSRRAPSVVVARVVVASGSSSLQPRRSERDDQDEGTAHPRHGREVSRRLGGWPGRRPRTPAGGCGRRWRSTATGGPPRRGRPRRRRPPTAGPAGRCPPAARRRRRPASAPSAGRQPADLVGHRLGVEGDRVGQEDGVGQAVRDAGAPADELRQPVVHAHARR